MELAWVSSPRSTLYYYLLLWTSMMTISGWCASYGRGLLHRCSGGALHVEPDVEGRRAIDEDAYQLLHCYDAMMTWRGPRLPLYCRGMRTYEHRGHWKRQSHFSEQ